MVNRRTEIYFERFRPSFTLIELLVSISIIGIMASMVLYTLAGAQEDALRNRTRVTIEKLNSVILERWEGYRYRSVNVPVSQDMIRSKLVRPRSVAELRAAFLKDIMRMEMPDRQSDLTYTPIEWTVRLVDANNTPLTIVGPLGREFNILRNYFNLATVSAPFATAAPYINTLSTSRPPWSSINESAECLYAIVAHSTSGGGSALEGFHTSEIGDTDKDSYPEFLDAWGNPISWIRWPAAFESNLNLSYKGTDPANQVSPDAFDPLRTSGQWSRTQKPWTLVPLILSNGSDELPGIEAISIAIFATTRHAYYPNTDAPEIGRFTNRDEAIDNITNHDILFE